MTVGTVIVLVHVALAEREGKQRADRSRERDGQSRFRTGT